MNDALHEPLSSRIRLYPSTYPEPAQQVAGEGLGILVNANAKRGGRRIAAQLARALPGASVRLTRRVEEIDEWLSGLGEMRAVIAAGGDGTAQGLLTALDRRRQRGEAIWPAGMVPLGTGNALAHALGARKLDPCVRWLQTHQGPLATRSYTFLRCEGLVSFFAGSGWDAQLLDDYKAQLGSSKGPIRRVNKSAYGYLSALFTRTVPKALWQGRPEVRVVCQSEIAYGLDARGVPVRLEGDSRGRLLYEGPFGCTGAATCPEFGYRFRAFPFAERFPGLMNVRVYAQTPLRAVRDIPKLWGGVFPLEGMTDFFCERATLFFSRKVPLQVGGEAIGTVDRVDFEVAEPLEVLDWRGI